ncbi:hypothetical protein IC235_15880 [Hymenobacter sp. BT664]|uniref:Tetratricopeptide repeat protein n=1 Tax=Hymenobacter montanus TaxID=2771359 RepID=A0A927BFZ8_9BACT|nr:hypothetical protein [Hymenobacter montanus]MBD2769368.1 hypothetical protein [Hymenobacter montanus]
MGLLYENGITNGAGFFEYDRALFHLAQSNYKAALTLLDKAIADSPRNFHFYKCRAYAKAKVKDYAAALVDIELFLLHFKKDNLHPTGLQGNESILFAKAFCLAEAGQLEESLLTIDQYLLRMRFDKRAYYLAGVVECRLGNFDKAIERLNTALGKQAGDFSFLYLTTEQLLAMKLLEWLQTVPVEKSLDNEPGAGSQQFPLGFYPYYFIDLEGKMSEAYSRLKRMDALLSEDEVYSRANDTYFDYKTCQRCQMAPCHCSDPDFD